MSTINQKVSDFCRGLVSAELKNRLNESPDVILVNYHKLKSSEMTKLRKQLKSAGAGLFVMKNSLMRKVFADLQKPAEVEAFLEGQTALVFVKKDMIGVTKTLINFNKEIEAFKISGGFLTQRVISCDDVKRISKLSSMNDLYQQVASALNAPIGKLATSLNQIILKLVYALKAVNNSKK